MRTKLAQSEQVDWLPSIMEPSQERRRRPRVGWGESIVLTRPGTKNPIEVKAENVSSDGFYCLSPHPFSPDEILDCHIDFPGDQVSSVPEDGLRLSCQVRVVRVVTRGLQPGFGVACHVEGPITRSAI